MLLTSIPIKNYQNVNSFNEAPQWTIRAGEANTLYFRIVDLDQNGLRYLPLGSPVSMNVTFTGPYNYTLQAPQNYFTPAPTVKIAVPADPNDLSIWKINILPTDKISSGNVFFSLTNGTQVSGWVSQAIMSVQNTGTNVGGC